MLVRKDGQVIGSLSGGCVESDVVEHAFEVFSSGVRQVVHYGQAALAWDVGMMCGGSIEVLVEPLPAMDPEHWRLINSTSPLMLVRREEAWSCVSLPQANSDSALQDAAGDDPVLVHQLHAALRSGLGLWIDRSVLVEIRRPAPRSVLFGANDFTAALATSQAAIGDHVVVIDHRPRFAESFAATSSHPVVCARPAEWLARAIDNGLIDERTALCCLHHDADVEIPLLQLALQSSLVYVGAMGSRRTDTDRRKELTRRKVSLEKLRSPIGLNLGAVSPAEVAVSVTAEIVATRHGVARTIPLSDSGEPIHQEFVASDHCSEVT